jgi:hypothetical protein
MFTADWTLAALPCVRGQAGDRTDCTTVADKHRKCAVTSGEGVRNDEIHQVLPWGSHAE